MGDDEHALAAVAQDGLAEHRQRPRHDAEPGLASLRGKGEGVGFPSRVLLRKALLDLRAAQPLPSPVVDLPESVLRNGSEAMPVRNDGGRLGRSPERAGVDLRHPFPGEPLRQPPRLLASPLGELGVGRAREAVFGAQDRRPVTNQEDSARRRLFLLKSRRSRR